MIGRLGALASLFVGAVIAFAASPCAAAADAELPALKFEPDQARLACLRSEAGQAPAYPKRELEEKVEAVVRVRLTFKESDAAPEVRIFYNSAGPAFAAAVRDHLSGYRLPCMDAGRVPVVAVQEFQFTLRKVIWSPARIDEDDDRIARCVTTERPEYPRTALQRGDSGVVLARVTFTDPGSAPEAEIVYDAGSSTLANSVRAAIKNYRLPCMPKGGSPVSAIQAFVFKFAGEPHAVFKDLGLKQFLGLVDGLDRQRVRFDFNTMACPFELRLRLYQPYLPNQVGQVDEVNPNRRELLEWLATLSLKLPSRTAKQVVGDNVSITVPCGVLDLT